MTHPIIPGEGGLEQDQAIYHNHPIFGRLQYLRHLFACIVIYCALFPTQIGQESNFGIRKYLQDKKRRQNPEITKS